VFPFADEKPPEEHDPLAKGFLQLCADRRFHLLVMEAFEEAAGLQPDEYYIEARPGGAPSWRDATSTGRIAYRKGARMMGWAAHGDRCLGFPGLGNDEVRAKLEEAARRRSGDFPEATHFLLFATEAGGVEVQRLSAS
jgi:hypothetical protein